MREMLMLLLTLALAVMIAFLVVRSSTEAAQQRERLETRIKELLQREQVTLADFLEAFGEPRSVTSVACEGTTCLKASWDLSYATRACWKRLIVVLNEQTRKVFFAEQKNLAVIEREGSNVRCVEAPE
jgi:hypothetical protein